MRRVLLAAALWLWTAAGPAHQSAQAPEYAPRGWPKTFDSACKPFDASKWSTVFPWGGRSTPGEQELYVDPEYKGYGHESPGLNPLRCNNGILSITADRPPPRAAHQIEGQLYTSGLLTSYRSYARKYGYFEIRARLPQGKGLWPAFWLLPTDRSWPPEIDVFEIAGDEPTLLRVTVHSSVIGNPEVGVSYKVKVPDMTTSFHSYGVLWTEAYVAWYFDGRRIASMTTPSDLNKPMYLLINLAVGGGFPGLPDATTHFPAVMQISYVRAYALPTAP